MLILLQYMAIPMTQQALPHANISPQPYPRASPRQSVPTIYDNAPSRRPSSAHAPPTRPAANHKAAPEDRDQGNRKAGERERDEESLLYAALDHQALPGATGRPQRPQEECSEYAAIRVHWTPGQHNNMLSHSLNSLRCTGLSLLYVAQFAVDVFVHLGLLWDFLVHTCNVWCRVVDDIPSSNKQEYQLNL